MTRKTVAVLHPDCIVYGGAEAVCVNVIEALQEQYEVTLFTFAMPGLGRLNEHFGTAVDPDAVSIRTVGSAVPALYDRVGKKFGVLAAAYYNRLVRDAVQNYDIVVSTKDEFALDDAIQYVHFPRFYQHDRPDDGNPGLVRTAYDRLCRIVGGFSKESLSGSEVLTNSEWTAGVIRDVYGVEPRVVYPPVNTERFAAGRKEDWEDRRSGFVSVGRITPDKNLLRNVEIVTRLVDRGHDVDLRIVGPRKPGRFDDYYERVRERAASLDHVRLEGRVEFDRLVELLQSYRYGLHGKANEHFGMSVAEMLAAGMVPFVPDDGGQTDIVDGRAELLYGDADEAVERIDAVLSDSRLQREIRAGLPDATERYGRDRFKREVREIVAAHESGATN